MRKSIALSRCGAMAGLVVSVSLGASACGDSLLPSDFQGPPAGEVSGSVVATNGTSKDADHPQLSIEWLQSLGGDGVGPALLGQGVAFSRSAKLASDWDIGITAPTDAAKLAVALDARNVRVAIGKMVYFDDRVPDGRIDWSCAGSACDRIKAVSSEFVVYLDRALTCEGDGTTLARTRVAAGYHYFKLDQASPRELPVSTTLSFTIAERSLQDGDPTSDLRAFASQLLRGWSVSLLACN